MPSEFSGKHLQGHSFKGQNLTGANFRKAKIQGTDFTDAILQKADFSHAQAGLQSYSATCLVIGLLLLSVILGLIAAIGGCFAGRAISQDILASGLWGIVPAYTIVLIAALVICSIIISQGLGTTYIVTFLSLIIIGAVAWANYRISNNFSPVVAIALTVTWGGGGIIVQTLFSAVCGVTFATVLGFRASAFFGTSFGTIFIVVVAI